MIRPLALAFITAAAITSSQGVRAVAPLVESVSGAPWITPVAMCGNTCRGGGRYIPGPPNVCEEEGLQYCGSSRDAEPRPRYRERRGSDYDEEPRRGPPIRERQFGFDEGEYLRCHPDVERAVRRGMMPSGAAHYQQFGRREGRRLTC